MGGCLPRRVEPQRAARRGEGLLFPKVPESPGPAHHVPPAWPPAAAPASPLRVPAASLGCVGAPETGGAGNQRPGGPRPDGVGAAPGSLGCGACLCCALPSGTGLLFPTDVTCLRWAHAPSQEPQAHLLTALWGWTPRAADNPSAGSQRNRQNAHRLLPCLVSLPHTPEGYCLRSPPRGNPWT